MYSLVQHIFRAAFCFVGLLSVSHAIPLYKRGFAAQDIITRDVCIIGGGATGTYSAVRLREDFNKSIVIVEKTGRLGGHTETYIDPITQFPWIMV
jgi:heterodisulfide reductase subunit A-like polyferredoxin